MHLAEILNWRSVPAAGISMGLTRRCPLHCAHCSTQSSMTSEQHPEQLFVRFVASFSYENRPVILAMSGGEALLRPRLVSALAKSARRCGTTSSVLSGLFFARTHDGMKIPAPIRVAIDAVDHFSVSLDAFHEAEVPWPNVRRVLRTLLDGGKDLSIHLVGRDADDPYLTTRIAAVRRHFGTRIPMLVNQVASFGRARAWTPMVMTKRPARVEAQPCTMAAWPVMGFDGRIVACGNDDAMDRMPGHLVLGHASTHTWAQIRERTLESSMMRAIRLYGPDYLAARAEMHPSGCAAGCRACMAMSGDALVEERVRASIAISMQKQSTRVLEAAAGELIRQGGALAFARRNGVARYADLALLGAT